MNQIDTVIHFNTITQRWEIFAESDYKKETVLGSANLHIDASLMANNFYETPTILAQKTESTKNTPVVLMEEFEELEATTLDEFDTECFYLEYE